MNLIFINEQAYDASLNVIDTIDQLYIKQHQILEFDNSFDLNKYDCFQEGFVKPVMTPELNVFKFENNHILNAIKLFNEAYQEIPFENTNFDEVKQKQERGELNFKGTYAPHIDYPENLINAVERCFRNKSGPFSKGLEELEKQFDCVFDMYVSRKQGTGTFISKFNTNPGKLTVSRTKGFQLGGLKMTINVNPKQMLSFAPADHKLFGQSLTSTLLHEIYHNIVHMIDVRNIKLHDDIKTSIKTLEEVDTLDKARAKINSFINRFIDAFCIKKTDINEERAIKRLYVLSQIQDNPAAMKKFEEDVKNNQDQTNNEKEIDTYIEKLNKLQNFIKIRKVTKMVTAACTILLAAVGFAFGNTVAAVVGTVGLVIMSLGILMKKVCSFLGIAPSIQEEYFCDLFAAMYKLPIHMTSYNRQIALNKNNSEKMTKIRKKDQSLSKMIKDVHPTTFDREVTSYKIAKQLLESDEKLSKEVRDYLQYIVNLHDGIEDIKSPDSKTQAKKLDPEAAKDLQKTLQDFIAKTGATVTESFIMDICGGEYYVT